MLRKPRQFSFHHAAHPCRALSDIDPHITQKSAPIYRLNRSLQKSPLLYGSGLLNAGLLVCEMDC